jgi:ubiquinone/menaquinone biosynthesis C-methylase UbiE
MLNNPYIEFKVIKDFCQEKFKEKELWPSYYERRYQEFLTFYDFFPKGQNLKILELGCGIGYYSAFLSKIADTVIATDLETIDPTTHSPGLQVTRDFLSSLGIKNVTVMDASAEKLPFEDNTFDMVFSSHVLEHVPDINKAIIEIDRVLKPGCVNFCIVPTSTDRLYAFFTFYLYILKRSFVNFFDKIKPKKNEANPTSENPTRSTITTSLTYYSKHLPFPPPHGVLPNYLSEIKNWTLQNWRKNITNNYQIKLVAQYGLQLNPLLPIVSIIFPTISVKLFSLTRKMETKIGKKSFFKYFGISTLLITEKKKTI